jgi:hypothetical protein
MLYHVNMHVRLMDLEVYLYRKLSRRRAAKM